MTEPDDRELEQYLKGDSPLSRRYRVESRETPPPDLDEAILARARSELRRRPRSINRWLTSLALAASIVLGVNLGWNVYRATPQPGEMPQMKDAAAAPRAAPPPESAPPAAPAPERKSKPASDDLAAGRAAERQKQADTASAAKEEDRARRQEREASQAMLQERAAEPLRRDALGAAAGAAPAAPAGAELSREESTARRASEAKENLPAGWHLFGDADLYDASVDQSTVHSPPSSLVVWRVGPGVERCGRLQTEAPAERFRNRQVQVKAFLRTQGVAGPNVMLFISYGFDQHVEWPMRTERFAPAEGAWQQRAVTLDVPEYAERIVYGALLCGPGTLWLDDIELN